MSKLSLLPQEVEDTIFSFISWREISPFVNHTFYRKYRKAAAQIIYRFWKKIYEAFGEFTKKCISLRSIIKDLVFQRKNN